jgi:hypothetical protein
LLILTKIQYQLSIEIVNNITSKPTLTKQGTQIMKTEIFGIVKEWSRYFESFSLHPDSISMHHGQFGDRVVELTKWYQALPYTSLYTNQENQLLLEPQNPLILMKLSFAAIILIVDDCFDSLDKIGKDIFTHAWEYNGEYTDEHVDDVEFTTSSGREEINQCFFAVNSIINISLEHFKEQDIKELYLECLEMFKDRTGLELTIHTLIESGAKIGFEERIKQTSLQGAMVSVYIDCWRIRKDGVEINVNELLTMSEDLNSLLSLINAQKTNTEEVKNGEISGPLYILACEMANVDLLSKRADIKWYQSQLKNQTLKTKLNDTIAELYNSIRVIMGFNEIDFKRFFSALSEIA